MRLRISAALLLATMVAPFSQLPGHEIPASVTVLAFLRPEGQRLRVLIRVPLEAMRDIELPLIGPGYLDLSRAEPALNQGARLWIVDYVALYENGVELGPGQIAATRVSLPSDRSFTHYQTALAHVLGSPLPPETELYWTQAMLDVLIEYPVVSEESRFSIKPALAHLGLRTTTVLRFLPPGESERLFHYTGDPGLIRLDPRWNQAAGQFLVLGFTHILGGLDHLLFLLCLVIPFRRFWALVPIVTSFTAGHSITLIASATGLAPDALWFPPLIETLIALSIVFMALENIVGPKLDRRWIIAFGFGLVHGFGFSFALSQNLQFAGTHLITSLLAFNIGVELGQLLVLAVMVPVLVVLFRRVVPERMGTIVLSALVAHTGWHWTTDRGTELLQYRLAWPTFDLWLAATIMRWLMLGLIVFGAAWLLKGLFGRLIQRAGRPEAPAVRP